MKSHEPGPLFLDLKGRGTKPKIEMQQPSSINICVFTQYHRGRLHRDTESPN